MKKSLKVIFIIASFFVACILLVWGYLYYEDVMQRKQNQYAMELAIGRRRLLLYLAEVMQPSDVVPAATSLDGSFQSWLIALSKRPLSDPEQKHRSEEYLKVAQKYVSTRLIEGVEIRTVERAIGHRLESWDNEDFRWTTPYMIEERREGRVRGLIMGEVVLAYQRIFEGNDYGREGGAESEGADRSAHLGDPKAPKNNLYQKGVK